MAITVTESARDHINNICSNNSTQAVCLDLKGGGCAGFEYVWSMIDRTEITNKDQVISCNSGTLVITEHALPFLEDVEIDFVTEMLGTKLVINNPNVKSACGCGESIGF